MPKGSIEWEFHPEEGLVLHIKPMLRKLLTEDGLAHVRTSRKEMLLALRSVIDTAVQKMDEKSEASGKGATKIKVE